jgi:hypothetical protein
MELLYMPFLVFSTKLDLTAPNSKVGLGAVQPRKHLADRTRPTLP